MMRYLLDSLRRICDANRMTEKILIMPSYAQGHQLLETATRDGISLINLRVGTLLGIAQERCASYLHQHQLEMVDPSISAIFMSLIMTGLQESGSLKYFGKMQINPGFVSTMYGTIHELRMSGHTGQDLKDGAFISPDKAADIKLIMGKYEAMLKEKRYIDEYDLYQKAIALGKIEKKEPLLIFPDNLQLNAMETKFFDTLSQGNVHCLGARGIPNVELPGSYYLKSHLDRYPHNDFSDSATGDRNQFTYLYDIDNLPDEAKELEVRLVRAYGENNETKAVLRDIKIKGISFDRSLILTTVKEPYSQLFYMLSQKTKLPMTFGSGINIKNTSPAKLYFSILNWIEENYSVSLLIAIFENGDLNLDDTAPSKRKIIRWLREAKIGWGKERYEEGLGRLMINAQDKLDRADNEDVKSYREEEVQGLSWLTGFVRGWFEKISFPNSKEKVDIAATARGIANLMERYGKIRGEMDAQAKAMIQNELSVLSLYYEGLVDQGEAIILLASAVEGLRVGASGPKPGYLHVAGYKRGIWQNRENTYILGLDAGKFPGQTTEDPILLDMERQEIGNGIRLLKNKAKEHQYEMIRLLAELSGKVTLSYSGFETLENKLQSPSSILLQVYRLMEKDVQKDYDDLSRSLFPSRGFIPDQDDQVLDEAEWWLKKRVVENEEIPMDIFGDIYGEMRKGVSASEARANPDFTPFDGKVEFDAELFLNGKNGKRAFSSSQLEMLATCPYKYFLKYVLGAEVPEEMEYDSMRWLDPASRGSLLHRVYELFYRELKKNQETPSTAKHQKRIHEIADAVMVEFCEELTPPSQIIYDLERKEILDSCDVFLANEERNQDKFLPTYFELCFGIRGEEHEDMGEISAVEIPLPNGKSIHVSGKIDRVDQMDSDTYRIIDYKTGSTFGYEDKAYFKNGKQLQHAIYSLALESILREKGISKNPDVIQAAYVFPTRKGQGRVIVRGKEKREGIYEVLEKLTVVLEQGSFIRTENEEDCTYCDYGVVCKNCYGQDGVDAIRSDAQDIGIINLRGLRSYE